MEGSRGRGEGEGGGEWAAELEDAVKLLVEHLVEPVLRRGPIRPEVAPTLEKQEIVARQVHAAVLLYNHYHRKRFPQLDFADPKRFTMSACLTYGEALLVYMNHLVHHHDGNGGEEDNLSVTEKAVVEACGIAQALDVKVGAPDMTTWPIAKVAVLLVDPTRKRCLIEHGAVTKAVWSILEKEINTASENSPSAEQSPSKALPSGPFVLQQTAYSMVESKTGIKRSSLCFLEEHRVYSLSKKETAAKLFIVQYEQTVNSNLKEVQLEDLIGRMSGPMFTSDPIPRTTDVVEFYHILPYKNIMMKLLNRDSLPNASANKPLVKEVSNSGTNSCSTRKKRKGNTLNRDRKSEALKDSPATSTEHHDGGSLRKENGSLSIPDAETLIFTSNPVNAEATRATAGGFVDLQTNVQMDKNRAVKDNAPEVNPTVKRASEVQIVEASDISGSVTDNTNDQMYASLKSLLKKRDHILREHCMLGDRSAQFDMDIQTILTEGKMTPRVMSILKRYENNSSDEIKVGSATNSEEGSQIMNMKRKKLAEAILCRNKCQELDEICRENNWILPRYTVLPSVIDGLYQASVHLICPDIEIDAEGDKKTTPREARESAATTMLYRLQFNALKLAEQARSTSDAALHDTTLKK